MDVQILRQVVGRREDEEHPVEAENLKVRAALMAELSAYIDQAGLTQAQAARRFGVTQPRIPVS